MMLKTIMILLLAGLFSNTALALDDAVSVKLEAQNNSGQNGTATLIPEGDKTKVVIEIPNAPAGVAEPAHIHLGSCDNLDKAPKWTLEAVKGGRSVTVVPVSLDTILKEKTAINIHKSAAEAQIYVSCGNIIGLM
jgi:Cu/Zn superoxide dismutase